MEKDLEQRTKRFSLAIIALADALPKTRAADVLARQLLRSATSIGANYEKQTAEFRAQTSPIKSGLCRKKLRKRNRD